MITLNEEVVIKRLKQNVFDIVKNQQEFSCFVAGVRNVVLLEQEGQTRKIKWRVEIEGAEVEWIEEQIIDEGNFQIHFKMISGDYHLYEGKWSLFDDIQGCRLNLVMMVSWGIPSFEKIMGNVLVEKMRKANRGMVLAIKRYAERRLSVVVKSPPVTFGFIIHPLDLDLVATAFNEPHIKNMKEKLVKKAFEWIHPFKCSEISGLRSYATGKEINGILIYFPLLPEQMINGNSRLSLEKIVQAVRIAEKERIKIVGIGAYASQIGKKGIEIANSVTIPVTTGTSYTIATVLEGVRMASQLTELDLSRSTVAIVGGTGTIGSVCAKLLVNEVGKLILVGRNVTRLTQLVNELVIKGNIPVIGTSDISKTVASSDVVLIVTNTPASLIQSKDLQQGTIVCDISRPRNVSEEVVRKRKDVLIFEGGIIKPPGQVNFNFYFGLSPGFSYACMAETMILALEERYENFSLGSNISEEKVREITVLGQRHGFRLTVLKNLEGDITKQDIQRVKEARIKIPIKS